MNNGAVETVFTYLRAMKDVFPIIKAAKDLLPDSQQKDEATRKIEEAERALIIAEGQAAMAMGHKLCRCTWPSQIMLYDKSKNVDKCPECGDEIKRPTKKQYPIRSYNKKP